MSERTGDTPGVRVLHLYDRYLNIYADLGNMQVLRKRCEWRGIRCEVHGLELGAELDPARYNLLYVGGGQDRDQRRIASELAGPNGAAIRAAVAAGMPLLGVCGGYQLLGRGYRDTDGHDQPGVGLFDVTTEAGSPRLIGNVAIEVNLPAAGSFDPGTIVVAGFENHAGRTRLGASQQPFGRVVHGHGNDGVSGFEGARADGAIGTYLHGPLLPRNPAVADWLIARALEYDTPGGADHVTPLDDGLEDAARTVSIRRAARHGAQREPR